MRKKPLHNTFLVKYMIAVSVVRHGYFVPINIVGQANGTLIVGALIIVVSRIIDSLFTC